MSDIRSEAPCWDPLTRGSFTLVFACEGQDITTHEAMSQDSNQEKMKGGKFNMKKILVFGATGWDNSTWLRVRL